MANSWVFPPPACVVLVGGVIVAIGTAWSAVWTATRSAASSERQRIAAEELLHKSEQITGLQQELIEAQKGLSTAQDKSAIAQEKLRVAQEALRAAQEQASTTYSGGDSFCYVDLEPTLASSDPFAMQFVLRHVGEYTVSDIRVSLLDMKSPGFDGDEGFEFPTLNKGDTRYLTPLKIKSRQVDLYGVRISARNNKVSQDIKIFRVGQHWAQSLKVTVIPNRNYAMSPQEREALSAAITKQSIGAWSLGGKLVGQEVKVQFDVGGVGRVNFERTDPDFPK